MESTVSYFAQSALISGGFLAIYHLFLKHDTFFTENRVFLLSGLVLSLTFPLIKIQRTIVTSKPILINTESTSTSVHTITDTGAWYTLENILLTIYVLVCVVMFIRLIVQLGSLKKLAANAKTWKERPFLHVETEKKITPFSFFNYIFYNPSLFSPTELNTVLAHEKVHARQYHTLDILLLEILRILFWFNPVLWLYKPAIKQNLEFLADRSAIQIAEDKKNYQYLMLKQVVENQNFRLTNSFYNSLIKKRIVMLNQNQSKRISVFKTLLVIPLLGLFLVSFSVENVYRYTNEDTIDSIMDDKSVELTINKDTSNDELDKIKKDLAKDGIDFSYTTVRNDAKEIIDISLNLSGKNSKGAKFSGNYSSNSDGPIDPIMVLYDDEANLVSFGNTAHKTIKIHKMDGDKIHWSSDDKTEVVIRKANAKKTVIVNGKELSDDEMEEMEIENGTSIFITSDDDDEVSKKIKVKRMKKDGGHIMIMKDSDDDEDIEVIGGASSFFFIDNDGGEEPLYYIDGKKVKSEDVKKISPDTIESINVLKGDKAIEKYGKKAKDGVIEITTKKGN